jgi:hypothetical protein
MHKGILAEILFLIQRLLSEEAAVEDTVEVTQLFLEDLEEELDTLWVAEEKVLPKPVEPDFAKTAAEIRAEDMKQHVEYLASDALEGRLTGTRGEILATEYVASVMEKAGLLPFGDEDGWYEPFPFTAGVALGPKNALSLKGVEGEAPLKVETHWKPLSYSEVGEVKGTGVIFAGYGIETPDEAADSAGKKLEPYSSYAHLEVKDRSPRTKARRTVH